MSILTPKNFLVFCISLKIIILCSFFGCSKDFAVGNNQSKNNWKCDKQADEALMNGDYESGILLHQQLLKKEPANALVHYHLGYAYGQISNHTMEVKYYEQAISYGYNWDDSLFFNLAMAYSELGMPQKAISVFEEALIINPESADSHFGLGLIYQAESAYQPAEREFLKAIKIEPTHLEARFNLSKIYFYRKEYLKAVYQLEKVLKYDPSYKEAYELKKEIDKLIQN